MNIEFRPDVREAIEKGRPVVALESTLITHGLPQPENLEVALGLEDAVRKAGAVPATIAILGGKLIAGCTVEQIRFLAGASKVRKCSRRDLPIVVSRGEDGATTVAGTMIVAHLAGIRVFATGGIGGVHRGHPFDVSADLTELGRTPITVVCAGAKAILDIPLTLEYLETQGVPVVGLGTGRFPAFYSRDSGFAADEALPDAAAVARLIRARDELGLQTGMLVTVPVPAEHELPAAEAEVAIQQALQEADARGIKGKEVTPFLLGRVSELTGARSKSANKALLLNNARVAGEIAVALFGK